MIYSLSKYDELLPDSVWKSRRLFLISAFPRKSAVTFVGAGHARDVSARLQDCHALIAGMARSYRYYARSVEMRNMFFKPAGP
jgi:hypothetical protein